MNKREWERFEKEHKARKEEIKAYNKRILSKPGLKQFLFVIGPYQCLKDEWGDAFMHLFVTAKSKAEAVRLKKASDDRCPEDSIRSRRHRWIVIPFEIGTVVLV